MLVSYGILSLFNFSLIYKFSLDMIIIANNIPAVVVVYLAQINVDSCSIPIAVCHM